MTSKLYKGLDTMDGVMTAWLVNSQGVAAANWLTNATEEECISVAKTLEYRYSYVSIDRFESRAVNPILIAEW